MFMKLLQIGLAATSGAAWRPPAKIANAGKNVGVRDMPTPGGSWRLKLHWVSGYLIAVVSTAAAIAIDLGLNRLFGVDPAVSLFLCAIVLVAWTAGSGPALLATALSVLAFDYFFLRPFYSLIVEFKEIPRLVLFAVAALFVVALSEAQRRAAASLSRARDEQQATVRELRELNEALRAENVDRRRAEDALRRSEAELTKARHEFQLIIDTVPILILRHRADGIIDFVNQVGRSYSGLATTNWTRRTSVITHPDDVKAIEAAWDVALATGEPFETEARLRRADGEYRWFATRRMPLRNDDGVVTAWYAATYDIEDRKRAETALRESETRLAEAERELRQTLDLIPTLAWRARVNGFADYLNRRWLDYTGITLEQAAGWEWRAAIHPDDHPKLFDAWRLMQASAKPDEFEARMRRFDGAYRWFLFRAEALRDETGAVVGWYGTSTDIEDRKRVETALQRSEAYSAEAQKLSRTGSLAWDLDNDTHFWSDETYQIMGFDRGLRPSIDLIMQRVHPDDRAHLRSEANRARQGAQQFDYEQRLLMPDGQIKQVHLRAHRVKYESGKEEIVGALMDVTEARKSQEALRAAQGALAHASRAATLGEISATIAHEVNQPLAAIVANGQACLRFLRREAPDLDDVRGIVEWIVKDANRASDVIQRVRGLLQKSDIQKTPLDVNDLIHEVAALLRRELADQRVVMQLELTPELPLAVADRIQLQQVLINLVINGAEAMQTIADRPHGLVIRSYEDQENYVVVAVKDSGVGIAGEHADRVFDAFFSTKPGGLGMGLSICRSIIEAHGGRLWSSANSGPGATFQFALPSHLAA